MNNVRLYANFAYKESTLFFVGYIFFKNVMKRTKGVYTKKINTFSKSKISIFIFNNIF